MQKKQIKNANFIAWIPERNKPDSEFKSNETTNQRNSIRTLPQKQELRTQIMEMK